MRAVVQRVASASVTVGGELRAECGRGLLVLLGIAEGDGDEHADRLARKVAHLRVFEDANGRLELSLLDVHGEALAVSQFTLIADTRKGSRPSFTAAARPELAEPLYERFCGALRAEGVPVQTGVFGARMGVSLVNDGPVTVILES
jgi:D-tyrosyl-tRNA(Tyr) deacylase